LAGFAAVRFLKSSPGSSFESGRGTAEGPRQSSRSEYRG
jgi:hypothetical protein